MDCPVCSGSSVHIIRTRNGFDLSRCVVCSLVYAHPLPSEAELTAFYQGFTYSLPDKQEFEQQARYTLNGSRRFSAEIQRLLNRPAGSILDYGGGLGFFANGLAEHFEKVTLFDLDAKARDYARGHFKGRFAVVETAEEALSGRYDVILVNQVIEHVPDPVSFLHQLRAALAHPDGLLIVTTPNNASDDALYRPDVFLHYWRMVSGGVATALRTLATNSWLCCDPPRHLFAFNDVSLIRAAREAGFSELSVSTAYFDRDPYGQPKYRWSGLSSLRSLTWSVLYGVTAITGPIARALDRRRARGTTLIAYFRAG